MSLITSQQLPDRLPQRHLANLSVLIAGPGTPGSVLRQAIAFTERHRRSSKATFLAVTHPLPVDWSLIRESEFTVALPGQPPNQIVVSRRPSSVGDLLSTLRVMARLRRRFDLYIGAGLHLVLLGLVLRRLGVVREVVYFSMDYWARKYKSRTLDRIYHLLDAHCATRADWVFNTSLEIPKARQRHGIRIDPARQIFVPHPIDLRGLGCLPPSEVEPDSLVSAGLASEEYGFELIIEAMQHVVRERPKAVVTVSSYGAFPDRLRAMIRELGLSDHFRFVGYIRDEQAFWQFLRSKRVGLAPYRPLPNTCKAFAEVSRPKLYMANGVPPIITRVPPIAEDIERSGAGLVVNYDPQELASAILRLLTDDDLWLRCRERGLELMKQFDPAEIYHKAFAAMSIATEC